MGNRNELRKPGPPELGPEDDSVFAKVVGGGLVLIMAGSTGEIVPAMVAVGLAFLINAGLEYRVLRREIKKQNNNRGR